MRELTKNRAALLRLLFTNPERSFYMQEIGRIIGKEPGNFQRTINRMEEEGILISEYRANARYFKVNKKYPLYKELKSIIFKTVGVIGSIKEVLEESGQIQYAFIYGSYAKGREADLSDIDLIIIGNPVEKKLIKGFDRLEELLMREINYKLYTISSFKEEIKEKSPFLLEILADKKIMVMGKANGIRKILEGQSHKKAKA